VRRATIYSRPGCHLCEQMKSVVTRVSLQVPLTIDEIDISGDETLEARYGQDIPVLLIDGTLTAKYRISEEELTRVIAARD
jgi:glutaredoxin